MVRFTYTSEAPTAYCQASAGLQYWKEGTHTGLRMRGDNGLNVTLVDNGADTASQRFGETCLLETCGHSDYLYPHSAGGSTRLLVSDHAGHDARTCGGRKPTRI